MKEFKAIISALTAAAILLSCTAAFAAEPIFGVDVSHHNGTVDFTDLQSGGKDFAMIRLGYYNHLDTKFEENVRAAETAEIEYGVYLYSYAYSEEEAEIEANFVVSVLSKLGEKAKHFTLPVAYDLEEPKMLENGLTKAQITKQMNIFCSIIRDAGYTPMVYANRTWLLNYIDINEIVNNDYKLWYAYWPSKIPTDFNEPPEVGTTGVKADMWQYLGVDDASSTSFDLNVIYDVSALISPSDCAHSFDAKIVPPALDERGYTLHTCSNCGREFKTDFVPPLYSEGWNYVCEDWYYVLNGVPCTGWQQIKNVWYYFDDNGVMQTGWQRVGSTWYYLKSSGAMATGWVLDGKKWYYTDKNGAMLTGWQRVGSSWYYFDGSGEMKTGWLNDRGIWYYLGTNGAMVTGWAKDGKSWYYLSSSGAMKTGWVRSSGSWYYLDGSGKMLAGTSRKISGKTYRFNSSGVCLNP